jgi:hypothetical protein
MVSMTKNMSIHPAQKNSEHVQKSSCMCLNFGPGLCCKNKETMVVKKFCFFKLDLLSN